MGADQNFDWRGHAASALEWWRDAGVDVLVDETPRDWFAAPVRAPAIPAAPLAAPQSLPETLAAFLAWRGGEHAPEAGWRGATVAASGPDQASVMILADCPDADDARDGTLMAGACGRLLDRMLAAAGLARDGVHLAAVCAKRPVAGRLPPEQEARLAELAHHHVSLVAPKRLLLMGNAASRAILGIELATARGRLHRFNHRNTTVEVVASYHPRFLIEKPGAKAGAWEDLQLLTGDIE